MRKVWRVLNTMAMVFVCASTLPVSFMISMTQSVHMGLQGERLLGFLIGFVGSVVCIIYRFWYLYCLLGEQKRERLRLGGLIYNTVWVMITMVFLSVILILSDFSVVYEYLYLYNKYQYFMIGILFVQWAGMAIFSNKYYTN